MPAPEPAARRVRAVLAAGLLLAGCTAEDAAPDRPAGHNPTAVLSAWLLPGIEADPAGEPGERDRSSRVPILGAEDRRPAADAAAEVIELEGGIPAPREPTPVRVHVSGVEVLTLHGVDYAAVLTDSGAAPERTAGLLPLQPVPASSPAATGSGAVGLWVTGAPFSNWGNGRSHHGEDVWHHLAPGAVGDDGYSCNGLAADELTPQVYPECLALHLGDDSAGHSPVYGFAADGYPVHGPWAELEILARSSWRKRDYAADSPTGCGESGRRTCLLADPLDPLVGAVAAPAPGPDTSAVPSGAFLEDYWFDIRRDDGSIWALDAFNGHTHDGSGYHYHITRIQNPDGSFTDVFPYILGPWFRGELHPGALAVGGPPLVDAAGAARAQPDEPDEPPPRPTEPPILCVSRIDVCD